VSQSFLVSQPSGSRTQILLFRRISLTLLLTHIGHCPIMSLLYLPKDCTTRTETHAGGGGIGMQPPVQEQK
jgi:hypothetical protein